MAVDPNIAALLTVPVSYQAKTGTSDFGQEEWAAPVTLLCYPDEGVRQIEGKDGAVYLSMQSLYFDATDEVVQGFQLGDKFTAPGIAGGQTMEAVEIISSYSPGPDVAAPMTAWLVEVLL